MHMLREREIRVPLTPLHTGVCSFDPPFGETQSAVPGISGRSGQATESFAMEWRMLSTKYTTS